MYVTLGQTQDSGPDLAHPLYGAFYTMGWRIKKGRMKRTEIAAIQGQGYADTVINFVPFKHGFQDAGFNKDLYPLTPDNKSWGDNQTLIKKAVGKISMPITRYRIVGGLPKPQLSVPSSKYSPSPSPTSPAAALPSVPPPSVEAAPPQKKGAWKGFLNTLPAMIPLYLQTKLQKKMASGEAPPSPVDIQQWQSEVDTPITQKAWFWPAVVGGGAIILLGGMFLLKQKNRSVNV